MNTAHWTRRDLMICGAAAFLVATRPTPAFAADHRVFAAVRMIFPDLSSSAPLGAMLADRGMASASLGANAERLDRVLSLRQWDLAGRDAAVLGKRLDESIAEDYAAGRVRKLAGCYFTDVERDLCLTAYRLSARA